MSNRKFMDRIALRIEPLDHLFFRGGRPMASGSRNRSELPGPQNLLGMIRTYIWSACGCDFSQIARQLRQNAMPSEAALQSGVPAWAAKLQVRGPWLAQFSQSTSELLDLFLPPPANLEVSTGTHWVLQPTQEVLPGASTSGGDLKPLWNKAWAKERVNPPQDAAGKKAEHALIRLNALREYLGGATKIASNDEGKYFIPARKLYALEPKVGIGLALDTRTVEEGLLFSTDLLRLNDKLCQGFYAEVLVEPNSDIRRLFEKPVVLTLGGESRCVSVRIVQPLAWPAIPEGKCRLFYLLAPAFFDAGAIPKKLPGDVVLCAAAIRDAYSVSGWDLARHGPKPVRFGVAAGSVYFTESLHSCEPLTCVCSESEDRAAGFGAVLQGVWNYA